MDNGLKVASFFTNNGSKKNRRYRYFIKVSCLPLLSTKLLDKKNGKSFDGSRSLNFITAPAKIIGFSSAP